MSSDDIGADCDEWHQAKKRPIVVDYRGPYTDTSVIDTIEGDFDIDQEYINDHDGFVIIRGVEDEIYPCGFDIFRETYAYAGDGEHAIAATPLAIVDGRYIPVDEHPDAEIAVQKGELYRANRAVEGEI